MWKAILMAVALITTPNIALAEQPDRTMVKVQTVNANEAEATMLAGVSVGVDPKRDIAVV